MEAILYNLQDMRSRRATATIIAKTFPMSTVSAGLAPLVIEMNLHALSFLVEYVDAMHSFHARLLSSAFSPCSTKPKIVANPQPW